MKGSKRKRFFLKQKNFLMASVVLLALLFVVRFAGSDDRSEKASVSSIKNPAWENLKEEGGEIGNCDMDSAGPGADSVDPDMDSAGSDADNAGLGADGADLGADTGVLGASESTNPAAAFYITEITDEIFGRMEGKSFRADCTVSREELRYVHILYIDFDGQEQSGELVVNQYIAEDVLEIFRQLYESAYPIEKVELVDEYGADDELSMEANNSSAFNFRFISHTNRISKHGLGMAVDINPLYNPYVKQVNGGTEIAPMNSAPYIDREADFPHKIDRNDLAYKLFTAHGFEWGGDWKSSKDWQHFEVPTSKISELYS